MGSTRRHNQTDLSKSFSVSLLMERRRSKTAVDPPGQGADLVQLVDTLNAAAVSIEEGAQSGLGEAHAAADGAVDGAIERRIPGHQRQQDATRIQDALESGRRLFGMLEQFEDVEREHGVEGALETLEIRRRGGVELPYAHIGGAQKTVAKRVQV